jgi:hypothetical protein
MTTIANAVPRGDEIECDHDLHAFLCGLETDSSLFLPAQLRERLIALALLSADVRLTTDSGGKTIAATRVLQSEDVLNALMRAYVWWKDCDWKFVDMNGGRGAILSTNGQPGLTITLASGEPGKLSDVFITLNPDKLIHLEPVSIQ